MRTAFAPAAERFQCEAHNDLHCKCGLRATLLAERLLQMCLIDECLNKVDPIS